MNHSSWRRSVQLFEATSSPMSLRIARVNELVRREIATYLSTRYRSETVRWTITSVEVSADLRNATVAYSVIGEESDAREAVQFLESVQEKSVKW